MYWVSALWCDGNGNKKKSVCHDRCPIESNLRVNIIFILVCRLCRRHIFENTWDVINELAKLFFFRSFFHIDITTKIDHEKTTHSCRTVCRNGRTITDVGSKFRSERKTEKEKKKQKRRASSIGVVLKSKICPSSVDVFQCQVQNKWKTKLNELIHEYMSACAPLKRIFGSTQSARNNFSFELNSMCSKWEFCGVVASRAIFSEYVTVCYDINIRNTEYIIYT